VDEPTAGRPPVVAGLFEAHLLVSDVSASTCFYRDVVGLDVAHVMPDRDGALLWAGGRGTSMIGLWASGSAPIGLRLHLAFSVSLAAVLAAPRWLRSVGVEPLSFFEQPTQQPSVIGWMPAAAVYFKDPDAHLLEFIATLDEPPRAELGIVDWESWSQTDPRSGAR
jgi:lactoylglutathione lyase